MFEFFTTPSVGQFLAVLFLFGYIAVIFTKAELDLKD